jgi:Holliday junction resolvasome RuvABC endonuclease subunit
MAVIGISCDNNSISYVVVDEKTDSPKILECETYHFETNAKGELLDSAKYRTETVVKTHKIKKAAALVVDTTYGKGQNTNTHPVKHQIEGVILHSFYKQGILFTEYNRKKLKSTLQKKLNGFKKTDDVKDFIKGNYAEECGKGNIKNDDQREAFAIALTQL